MKKFSIIVPTLNEEKYLPLLLDSIAKQSLQPSEIIVADAFSKDNTREIAKNYGCRVVNGGKVSVGRNRGVEAASSNLYLFIDADIQLIDKGFLVKFLEEFELEKLDIATCYYKNLRKNRLGGRLAIWASNIRKFFDNILNILFGRIIGASGGIILVKKQIFEKLQGFDENLSNTEDFDFLSRALKLGAKFRVLPYFVWVSGRRYDDMNQRRLLSFVSNLLMYRFCNVFCKNKAKFYLKRYEKAKGKMGG